MSEELDKIKVLAYDKLQEIYATSAIINRQQQELAELKKRISELEKKDVNT